jgi:predicted DNA binding CopG/RHH family protein
MKNNDPLPPEKNESLESIAKPIEEGLQVDKMGNTLRRMFEQKVKRKRQVSIMGAKQSVTLSLRKRYIERAKICSEYMGISMSTYIERLITKDNARYSRVINLLGSELKKHDELVGRLEDAAKKIDPLKMISPEDQEQDAELEKAIYQMKLLEEKVESEEDTEEDIDPDFDEV